MRYFLTVMLLLCSLLSFYSESQAQKVPVIEFGHNLALLTIPDTNITNVVLSETGDYVVATANQIIPLEYQYTFKGVLESSQYLWHIPHNLKNGLNWLEVDQHLILDKGERKYFGPDFALSPNGNYLIVRTESRMKLYRFPSFALLGSVLVNNPLPMNVYKQFKQISWSPDNEMVATLDGSRIVTWNILTNQVNDYDFKSEYDQIISLQSGWYVVTRTTAFDMDLPNGFGTCSWHLEQCHTYKLPANRNDSAKTLSTLDGQIVLTLNGNVYSAERSFLLWQQQKDNTYQAKALTISPEKLLMPLAFNPSHDFLLARIWPSKDEQWAILNFPTLTPLSIIDPTPTDFIWLPDGRHLITFDPDTLTFRLYEVGYDIPLDELKLPIEKIRGFDLDFSLLDDVIQISNDGSHLLLKARFGLFIIPINYE